MSTNSRAASCFGSLLLAAAFLAGPPAAAAQEATKSATAARQLGEILDRLKLDSIAAPDPTDPTTFVAALYFPGAQLLVVSAKYSAPSLLVEKVAKKDYRDVYIDLNAASIASSKIFVMDHECNGLVPKPSDSQAPDTWEVGTTITAFDGDWRRAKITEEAYLKSFAEADEKYARILTLLAEHAKKSGS
jgi:hypothetical protein